jgi:predicted PurR-regulated permease PerM
MPEMPWPTRSNEPARVRIELSFKSLLTVLALIAGAWLLLRGLPVLLVLVTALMLVGALAPVVDWFEDRRMRRNFAICLVFALATLVIGGLLAFTIPTVGEQVKSIAANEAPIREKIATYLEQSPLTAPLAADIREIQYVELLKNSKTTLLTLGTRLVEVTAYLIAAVFLSFYIMMDRDRLRGAVFAVVPRRHHIRLSRIMLSLGTIVGGYIRGQLLTCIASAVFILCLLLACRVPNALTLAVFGGVMDLLPYIGLFLTMVMIVPAAMGQGPAIAGTVLVLMLLYEEFESRVLVPLVYGRSLRLPASVVFFSLIVGTALGGIVGALLALPMAAAALMLVEELRVELPGEAVQPADLEQRREDNRTEREYQRRAESMPAGEAAAVAVEIVEKQKEDQKASPEPEVPADAKPGPA